MVVFFNLKSPQKASDSYLYFIWIPICYEFMVIIVFISSVRGPYLDVRVWRLNSTPGLKVLKTGVEYVCNMTVWIDQGLSGPTMLGLMTNITLTLVLITRWLSAGHD